MNNLRQLLRLNDSIQTIQKIYSGIKFGISYLVSYFHWLLILLYYRLRQSLLTVNKH